LFSAPAFLHAVQGGDADGAVSPPPGGRQLSLGLLPKKFPCILICWKKPATPSAARARGWGPGNFKAVASREILPGLLPNFCRVFLKPFPPRKPFCSGLAATTHRPYEAGSGAGIGLRPIMLWCRDPGLITKFHVTMCWTIMEVERYDRDVGEMLDLLEKTGQLENTIVS